MLKGKKVMALICARGGSKGVPGKNIRELGGRPLIAWSIEQALRCSFSDRVVVSTDSEKIARIAIKHLAHVPFIRPRELAMDDSPEWAVWQHALREMDASENFRPDYVVVLPPTSPFRSTGDIANGLEKLRDADTDIVISVTESGRNPYFNMVELDHAGYAHLSKSSDRKITRRQDAPKVYDMTTVLYAVRADFVLKSRGIFEGRVKILEVPEIRAMDIDTEMDLRFAEFLIEKGMVETDENRL